MFVASTVPPPNHMRKVHTNNLLLYGLSVMTVGAALPVARKLAAKQRYCKRMQVLAKQRKTKKRRPWSEEQMRFSERLFIRLFQWRGDVLRP